MEEAKDFNNPEVLTEGRKRKQTAAQQPQAAATAEVEDAGPLDLPSKVQDQDFDGLVEKFVEHYDNNSGWDRKVCLQHLYICVNGGGLEPGKRMRNVLKEYKALFVQHLRKSSSKVLSAEILRQVTRGATPLLSKGGRERERAREREKEREKPKPPFCFPMSKMCPSIYRLLAFISRLI